MDSTLNDNSTTEQLRPLTPFFFETSPPTFPTVSPFFRLPREVRDKIYALILQDLALFIRDGPNIQLNILYGTDRHLYSPEQTRSWQSLPRVFLTNKTLLSELLVEFYEKSRCVAVTPLWERCAPGSFSPGAYTLITLPRLRELDLTHAYTMSFSLRYSFTPLLKAENQERSPLTTEKPAFRCTLMSSLSSKFQDSSTQPSPPLVLYTLRERLHGLDHRIREVEYEVDIPGGPDRSAGFARDPETKEPIMEWGIDLSELERWMLRSESVVFNVQFPYRNIWGFIVGDSAKEFEMVQMGLVELGVKLVGARIEDGTGWSMEDRVKLRVTGSGKFRATWCLRVSRKEHGDGLKAFHCKGLQYLHLTSPYGCELVRRNENIPWSYKDGVDMSTGQWRIVADK
jgi:hypothetical protein